MASCPKGGAPRTHTAAASGGRKAQGHSPGPPSHCQETRLLDTLLLPLATCLKWKPACPPLAVTFSAHGTRGYDRGRPSMWPLSSRHCPACSSLSPRRRGSCPFYHYLLREAISDHRVLKWLQPLLPQLSLPCLQASWI